MEYVGTIFFLLFMVLLIVGLVKPAAFKNKKTGESVSRKQIAAIFGSLAVVSLFIVGIFAPKIPEAETEKKSESVAIEETLEKTYTIISMDDFSLPGRERLGISITAPDATTFESRAHTVMKAAKDYQKKTGADFVGVRLELSKILDGRGRAIGIANYAPDGKGTSGNSGTAYIWEVEAYDGGVVDPKVQKISELWEANKKNFQNDGMTDEEKLKVFIAKKMNIPVDQVNTFLPSRIKYKVN